LEESYTKDRKWWKVGRLVGKDEDDYNDLVVLIGTHFKLLKDIFIHTAAGPDWPFITQMQLQVFCDSLNLIDGKLVRLNDIQRIFITVNVELIDQDFNPDAKCNRFEFIEFLVRLSALKYKQTKVVYNYTDAFQMLLNETLIPYHRSSIHPKINVFKAKFLTNTPIDYFFYDNQKGL
jgi:hypothetical protein